MNSDRPERARELCRAAEGLSAEAREQFLREQTGDDAMLRGEVEHLLQSLTAPMTFEFLTEPDATLTPAPEQISHYRIYERLGQGGMGVVYRGTDMHLNRPVAIKCLPLEKSADQGRRQRFLREALTASSLNHPNIVTIYGIEQIDDVQYMVMEYVRGVTLADRIRQGKLAISEVVSLAIQVADAVATAHAAGIVHRDLKPANIMITNEGFVKLLDFGIAKLAEPWRETEADAGNFTTDGVAVGTLAYMSPEQARGQKVDARSDIFSFGLVLYEMLTARHAFAADSALAVMHGIMAEEPVAASNISPDVPHELNELVLRCLHKSPEKRPQDMAQIKLAFEELRLRSQTGQLQLARPQSRSAEWARRAGAAIVILAALAGADWWWRYHHAPANPRPAELVRLTSDSGLTSFPALSADGRMLCYSSDRGSTSGNLNLWVQQLGGGDPIRITNDETDDIDPAFSLDGTHIAYHSDRKGGGIYVVPTLGGTPWLVAPQGRHPRFSPDGTWLTYWVGQVGSGFVTGSARMYIVPAAGGKPRQVRPEFAMAFNPLWMPDGKHLLFVGRLDGKSPAAQTLDWWTAPLEGGTAARTGALEIFRGQKLLPRGGSFVITPDAWAPAGGGLLFSARRGDTTNLWQLGFSSRGKFDGLPRRLTAGTNDEVNAAVAHDKIVFASHTVVVNIWRTNPELMHVTDGVSFQAYPSISADGRRMAFISARSGNWELWLKDLKTGQEVQLTRGPVRKYQPKISGDGSHIAYWQLDGQKGASYMVDSQGEAVEKICEPCGPPTNISNDGRRVLLETFTSDPPGILLADMATKKQFRFIVSADPLKSIPYAARFSPDERWVAFHRTLSDSALRRVFVAVIPPDASPILERDWIPVTEEGRNLEAHWSSDGNFLYYLSDRDGFRCIWGQRLDSIKQPAGPPFAVQHFHEATRSILGVGGSAGAVGLSTVPGGLIFALGDLKGNLWALVQETQK
jgi:serine/threonine protein kinase